MANHPSSHVSLRTLVEDDLPIMFEIQFDHTARHLAAFTDRTAEDREAYLQKHRKILANDANINKAVEVDGEVVGSVAAFPIEGRMEVTYWIRKDWWGRGVATAALASLLQEVTARPIYGRAAEDNVGSIRVLERNGFVLVGRQDAFATARQAAITELIFELTD